MSLGGHPKIEVGTGLSDSVTLFHTHPFVPFSTPIEVDKLLTGASVVAVRIGSVVAPWSLVDFAKYVQFGVVPDEQKQELVKLQTFSPDYQPTIEEKYKTSLDIDGRICVVNIVDTGAQELYHEYLQKNLAMKDGYMLVYSQGDKESLDKLSDIVAMIQDIIGKEGERTARKMVSLPPMLLIANKKDLPEKTVTSAEGSAFNRAYRLESRVETSAKDFDSVKLAFQILVRCMLNARDRQARMK